MSGLGSHPSSSQGAICTKAHVFYCFEVLEAYLSGQEPGPPPFDNADEAYALFVTWKKESRHGKDERYELRGCIGNFSPMVLRKGLPDYAITSAVHDSRFKPITAAELPLLACSVSLLTPFTPIKDPLDWEEGEHGIHLSFSVPSSPVAKYSATYLPEICPDQGWTKEQTVLSAIQKSGWRRKVRIGDAVWQSLKMQRYGSVKVGATWEEYLEWKKTRRSTA